ncbi:methyl-accepting chemotaxis protein [Arcobacter sp. CECT 8989]|uniref:methyl-accepting chemotaxis protein n=1 Tax=Arcobacter sp. CECT 8989 TaxID=2044509 RepID=UPI0035C05EEF
MMNNLSTKIKLSILAVIALVGLMILGVMSIVQLKKVNAGLETVYNDRVVPLEQLKIIADEYAVNIVDTTHQVRNNNISFEKCIANISSAEKKIQTQWQSYISTTLTKEEQKLATEAERLMKIGTEVAEKIKEACKNKDLEVIAAITIQELYPKIDPIGEKISALIALQLEVAKQETDLAFEIYNTSKIMTISTIIIALIIIIFLAFLIISDITKKLSIFKNGLDSFFSYLNRESSSSEKINITSNDEFGQMAKIVNKNIEKTQKSIEEDRNLIDETISVLGEFEQGDLCQRLNLNVNNPALMELKTVLNKMADNLENNIDNILNILEQYSNYNYLNKIPTKDLKEHLLKLSTGVNDLGSSITSMLVENKSNGLTLDESSNILLENVDKLNDSSTEAASSLEETAAALEEITSNIRHNTENIAKMAQFSTEVTKSATEGEDLASHTTNAMEDINTQVTSINDAITVIDQIAFQTNILSLNAAVEAATAGEAGKGFAVVAQEVRNLANRSAEAAKEIKALVENATVKANEGKNIASNMIQGYKLLNENISHTTGLIADIENASKEQLLGIEQINDAVNQLDQQTQKNAMVASEAHDIASLTDEIAKLVVSNANAKEFEGKNDVQAKEIKRKKKEELNIPNKKFADNEQGEWESF